MSAKPNIVLIVADDMGYGDCGCYGCRHLATPHLDDLARRGVRFIDFHANGPLCSPTRAALLTGRYQQRSGIEGVISAAGHRHVGLPLAETTFAEVLREHGYRTALFGKWHLGYERQFNPVRRGFEAFRGFVAGNVDYVSHIDQVGEEDWWRDDSLTPEDGYTTDLVTEHGVRFIQEHRDEPFCLYLAHECPHYPYQGPDDPGYRTPGHPHPIFGPREDQAEAYREMMECLDAGIGRVVATLRENGLEENTLVFFFSDNGPAGPGSAGPLRGGKSTVWEGGHRVPAIACWPGHLTAGSELAAPGMSMDLFPTMLALADIAPPPELALDGIDLGPVMTGSAPAPDRDLFWRLGQHKAVRSGPWKLVVDDDGAALFNLDDDLGETTDLAAQLPERLADLQARLATWEADVGHQRLS